MKTASIETFLSCKEGQGDEPRKMGKCFRANNQRDAADCRPFHRDLEDENNLTFVKGNRIQKTQQTNFTKFTVAETYSILAIRSGSAKCSALFQKRTTNALSLKSVRYKLVFQIKISVNQLARIGSWPSF